MNAMQRLIGLTGAALLSASFSGPAFAAEEASAGILTVRSAVVRYDDLSLDGAAGVRMLYARLVSAAKRVCGPADPSLRATLARRECRAEALAEAVASSGNPELAVLHEAARAPARLAPRIAAAR